MKLFELKKNVRTVSKRELLANTIDALGAHELVRRVNRWSGLVVLNYHRIGLHENSRYDWGLWSASLEDFERQVRYLSLNFDVVGENDLKDVFRKRSGRHVMITFDDGYRDNYELAYPILRTHNVPAIFFLATGFLDDPRIPWWDEIAWMVRGSRKSQIPTNHWTKREIAFDEPTRENVINQLLKVYKSLNASDTEHFLNDLSKWTGCGRCPPELADETWMTWDMAREIASTMGIGGHTVNHQILANLSPAQQEYEIHQCKERIETELGRPIKSFSIPIGSRTAFNLVTRKYLRKYGFEWNFSFYGGYARLGHGDPLDIPRAAVESDIRFPEFQATVNLPQLYA